MNNSKKKKQLLKEAKTVISIAEDFCTTNGLHLLIVMGNIDKEIGVSAIMGTPQEMTPLICCAATDLPGVFHSTMLSAEVLQQTAERGFDYDAVHEGRSTSEDEFAKIVLKEINAKKNKKK